jgi:hypothetical protein
MGARRINAKKKFKRRAHREKRKAQQQASGFAAESGERGRNTAAQQRPMAGR